MVNGIEICRVWWPEQQFMFLKQFLCNSCSVAGCIVLLKENCFHELVYLVFSDFDIGGIWQSIFQMNDSTQYLPNHYTAFTLSILVLLLPKDIGAHSRASEIHQIRPPSFTDTRSTSDISKSMEDTFCNGSYCFV